MPGTRCFRKLWLIGFSLKSQTWELHEEFIYTINARKKYFRGSETNPSFTSSSVTHTDLSEKPKAGEKQKQHFLDIPHYRLWSASPPLPPRPPRLTDTDVFLGPLAMHQLIAAYSFVRAQLAIAREFRFAHMFSILRVNKYFTCTRSRMLRKRVGMWLESLMQPGTKRKVIHKPSIKWVFNSHTMTRVIPICAFDLCLSPLWIRWQFNRAEWAHLN